MLASFLYPNNKPPLPCFLAEVNLTLFIIPIFQAAFLSALAGVEVAEAAAEAAVTALSNADYGSVGKNMGSHEQKPRVQGIYVVSS